MVDILKLRKMEQAQSRKSDEAVAGPKKSEVKPEEPAATPVKQGTDPKPTATTEVAKPDTDTQDTVKTTTADKFNSESSPDREVAEVVTGEEILEDEQDMIDLVVFGLGERLFGIEITEVQEVVRSTEITRVPHAPRYVLGVMNLRGNITPVIDLHSRFDLGQIQWSPKSRIIVLQLQNQAVGFMVDQVTEILHAYEKDIESAEVVQGDLEHDYIAGVVKVNDDDQSGTGSLLILLKLENIFEEEQHSNA